MRDYTIPIPKETNTNTFLRATKKISTKLETGEKLITHTWLQENTPSKYSVQIQMGFGLTNPPPSALLLPLHFGKHGGSEGF